MKIDVVIVVVVVVIVVVKPYFTAACLIGEWIDIYGKW